MLFNDEARDISSKTSLGKANLNNALEEQQSETSAK